MKYDIAKKFKNHTQFIIDYVRLVRGEKLHVCFVGTVEDFDKLGLNMYSVDRARFYKF